MSYVYLEKYEQVGVHHVNYRAKLTQIRQIYHTEVETYEQVGVRHVKLYPSNRSIESNKGW